MEFQLLGFGTSGPTTLTFYSGEFDPKYLVTRGDILVAMDGEFRVTEWSGPDSLLNQRVCKIIPDVRRIDKGYLLNCLPAELKRIEDRTPFATVKHLSTKAINAIQIPLPPLPIQKQIADLLDAADALRRKTQEQLDLLDDLARSVFLEMFGDPVTNEKGWEVRKLGALVTMVGSGSTPRGGQKVYKRRGFAFIRSQNIRNNKVDFSNIYYIDASIHVAMSRTWVNYGDVLLNITGASIGRAAVYFGESDQANVNQHVCIIRTKKEELNPQYLLYHLVFPSYNRRILGVNAGGTREAFNFKQIKQFSIVLPPIDVQMKFSAVLENLDIQRRTITEAHAEAERLFASLQQKLFQ